jgi:hypothetical protein
MNSEQQISWRRHMVFDPMNAHSQADAPALTHVMQFNADERQCQERRIEKISTDCDVSDLSLRAAVAAEYQEQARR